MSLSERFELERTLGQGTFGTTHLARERATDRKVAIKQLTLHGLPEWRPVELFEREARVLRSLDHPGIPAFVDAFEDDDPERGHAFYIVSEHVDGPTLQAEISGGRRYRPEQARTLFRQLLQTLEYLHSLSPRVIHRDVKPGNVVLRSDGRPVLVDFGSVRDIAARQADGGMTIAGTAGYMAPEQAMGIADVRSDLYGAAATMAHVLTHVHPSDLPRQGLRPQLGDLTGVDATLASILERLLDPDPERRFGSAKEVLRVLEGAKDEPAAAAPVTSLAHRDAGPELALARLTEGPRTVGPEIEDRLGYVRAMRGALPLSLGTMLGGMSIAIGFAIAGLPVVTVPLLFASIGGFLLAPLPKRKQLRQLYATGAVTRGRLIQARSENGSLFVTYAFRHEDREYKGYLLTNDALIANRVGPDTPVFVFYDPKRPKDNAGLLPDELPKDLRDGVGEGQLHG
ncbi:serine/threonine protein kinase [Paraliomyxa miuraensis]|uniref:serine/threonine protein kinase n=1 Tax=Paraliomyxa miuraensis TaxID=376150 RepID=UPI002255FEA9|nr:serine/threonine-protein kinase [Paraliomyxa miuraensis]MCX4247345.1 serine/threonine protein kinase [Paraliomyxa miuraensis]